MSVTLPLDTYGVNRARCLRPPHSFCIIDSVNYHTSSTSVLLFHSTFNMSVFWTLVFVAWAGGPLISSVQGGNMSFIHVGTMFPEHALCHIHFNLNLSEIYVAVSWTEVSLKYIIYLQ